jgi:hypothetical protein
MRARLAVEQLERRDAPASFETLPVLPFSDPAAVDHARAIFARGQQLGRRADAFVKFGDSNTSRQTLVNSAYLVPLGVGTYNPHQSAFTSTYPELLDTWSAFRAPVAGGNSFSRLGPGAAPGWTSGYALSGLPTELVATNAAIAFIMVGTNNIIGQDIGLPLSPAGFRTELHLLVQKLVAAGVVPIVSTIPDMAGSFAHLHGRVLLYNQIIADVAAHVRVPLWNTWRSLLTLPGFGLGLDGLHLTVSPNGGGSFYPIDLLFGQNLRNLQALQILDWFRETVARGPAFVAPAPSWQAMADSRSLYAVGRDVGFSPTVTVYDAATGQRVNRFLAFEPSFGGGVRSATGDVNGDGFTDVVCATAAGTFARVRAFSGKDGSVLANRVPFGIGYTGGLCVAVGDLDDDGVAEVVVGKTAGRSGVRVYHGGDFSLVSAFRAFPRMSGGVSVAVANVAAHGPVVAVTSAANPVVRLFDASGTLVSSFRAFGGAGYGITVAAADLTGDGSDELAVSPSAGSRHVSVLNPATSAMVATFTVAPSLDPVFGIRLGTLRTHTSTDTLLVGNGPGSALSLLWFDDLSGPPIRLAPTNPRRAYGIFAG